MIDYFVSAENTAYQHWQLELLIESFKLQGLQDNLAIALANNQEEKLVDFTHNIKKHKRIFLHDNRGLKSPPLNRIYSLFTALENKLVKQPLVLIDPDMILVTPVSYTENITFQVNPLFTKDYCPIEIGNWIPLGSVMIFNDVPLDFFKRVIERAESLELDKNCWHNERVAWILTMLEYHGHISYKGVYDLEMTMMDNLKHNFIHYTKGLPPVFNKYMYKYKPPNTFVMGNLFDCLLENNPTMSTDYMQQVVRSYLKIIPKSIEQFQIQQVKVNY